MELELELVWEQGLVFSVPVPMYSTEGKKVNRTVHLELEVVVVVAEAFAPSPNSKQI